MRANLIDVAVTVLGRSPSPQELAAWAQATESGQSLGELAGQLLSTAEGQARFPSVETNVAYLTNAYQMLFGRVPDDEGLAYWLEQLEQNTLDRDTLVIVMVEGARAESGNPNDAAVTTARGQAADTYLAAVEAGEAEYDTTAATVAVSGIERADVADPELEPTLPGDEDDSEDDGTPPVDEDNGGGGNNGGNNGGGEDTPTEPTFTVTEKAGMLTFDGTATGPITFIISGEAGSETVQFTRGDVKATAVNRGDFSSITVAEGQEIIATAKDLLNLGLQDNTITGAGTVRVQEFGNTAITVIDTTNACVEIASGNVTVPVGQLTNADNNEYVVAEGATIVFEAGAVVPVTGAGNVIVMLPETNPENSTIGEYGEYVPGTKVDANDFDLSGITVTGDNVALVSGYLDLSLNSINFADATVKMAPYAVLLVNATQADGLAIEDVSEEGNGTVGIVFNEDVTGATAYNFSGITVANDNDDVIMQSVIALAVNTVVLNPETDLGAVRLFWLLDEEGGDSNVALTLSAAQANELYVADMISGEGMLNSTVTVNDLASGTNLNGFKVTTLIANISASIDISANENLSFVDTFNVQNDASLMLTAAQANGNVIVGEGNVTVTDLGNEAVDLSGIAVEGAKNVEVASDVTLNAEANLGDFTLALQTGTTLTLTSGQLANLSLSGSGSVVVDGNATGELTVNQAQALVDSGYTGTYSIEDSAANLLDSNNALIVGGASERTVIGTDNVLSRAEYHRLVSGTEVDAPFATDASFSFKDTVANLTGEIGDLSGTGSISVTVQLAGDGSDDDLSDVTLDNDVTTIDLNGQAATLTVAQVSLTLSDSADSNTSNNDVTIVVTGAALAALDLVALNTALGTVTLDASDDLLTVTQAQLAEVALTDADAVTVTGVTSAEATTVAAKLGNTGTIDDVVSFANGSVTLSAADYNTVTGVADLNAGEAVTVTMLTGTAVAGSAAKDTFVFGDLTVNGNTITEFNAGSDDTLQFTATIGQGFTADTALTAAQLVTYGIEETVTAGTDARFIFDEVNGVLYFDAGGDTTVASGTITANGDDIEVATLTGVNALAVNDFAIT